jgi:hypothetical protein
MKVIKVLLNWHSTRNSVYCIYRVCLVGTPIRPGIVNLRSRPWPFQNGKREIGYVIAYRMAMSISAGAGTAAKSNLRAISNPYTNLTVQGTRKF